MTELLDASCLGSSDGLVTNIGGERLSSVVCGGREQGLLVIADVDADDVPASLLVRDAGSTAARVGHALESSGTTPNKSIPRVDTVGLTSSLESMQTTLETEPKKRERGGGRPPATQESTETRFWRSVHKTDSCWLWTGQIQNDGYGQFFRSDGGTRRYVMPHRFAYEVLVGPIPEGFELDHVKARGCTNRHCVNPAHLEPVTPRENTLRSDNRCALNARKTRCIHGHELSGENLVASARDKRECRTCKQANGRAYLARRRAVRIDESHPDFEHIDPAPARSEPGIDQYAALAVGVAVRVLAVFALTGITIR